MMLETAPGNSRERGFTLMELMVVVVIVAILAAIAYPSYREQVYKSKRAVAKQALYTIAARQEQYFMDNKTYTNNLVNLGFSSSPAYIDSDGNYVAAASGDRIYALSISASTTTTFTAQATPQLAQSDDSRCATLTLNNEGTRGVSGATLSARECW